MQHRNHHDRTVKQPLHFRCYNPECMKEAGGHFEWEGDQVVPCPRCASSRVVMLSLCHFMLPDSEGPIESGATGMRYRKACDATKRGEVLATHTNNESASGDLNQVNCPGCLKVVERLRVKSSSGVHIRGEGKRKQLPNPQAIYDKFVQRVVAQQ